MSKRYRTTLSDRLGPDAWTAVPALAWGLYVGILFVGVGMLEAYREGYGWVGTLAFGIGTGIAAAVGVAGIGVLLPTLGGMATQRLMEPGGTPRSAAPDFSAEEARVMRGDVAGALAEYEAHIARDRAAPGPVGAAARLRAADLYAGKAGDPRRAAALLREVRALSAVLPRDDLYAANRLVDLYLGPLDDEPRALAELRSLAERHPGSTAATHARATIARLTGARPG